MSQNSQEKTCARVSFLIKLKETLAKKRLQHRGFPVNFATFLRTPFSYRTPPVAAYVGKEMKMFHTIFSFYSMIFLVQCRGSLCNVGATGYYQKVNWSKIKIAENCCSDDSSLSFFLCYVVWILLGNITQGFYLCNVVPYYDNISACAMLPGASWSTLHKVFTCSMLFQEY